MGCYLRGTKILKGREEQTEGSGGPNSALDPGSHVSAIRVVEYLNFSRKDPMSPEEFDDFGARGLLLVGILKWWGEIIYTFATPRQGD
jgi:hypothetical protein